MTIGQDDLLRLTAHEGRVARIVVAEARGSTPRETGAEMFVWAEGQSGTIGGGALEFQAVTEARAQLAQGVPARVGRLALGPALSQCCGGTVTLLTEIWDGPAVRGLAGPVHARPLPGRLEGSSGEMPLAVRRILARARAEGQTVPARIVHGWFVEPVAAPARPVWIWGAGHVGRALVGVLSPLPGLALTWIDTDRARFPEAPDPRARMRVAADPATLVPDAPTDAAHLVLTFSHALDLELCHRLLAHDFASLGLIGSATKRARFRARLAALGHGPAAIGRIMCPIGQPELGKHPQAIALGVAMDLIGQRGKRDGAGQGDVTSDTGAEDAGNGSAATGRAGREGTGWKGRNC